MVSYAFEDDLAELAEQKRWDEFADLTMKRAADLIMRNVPRSSSPDETKSILSLMYQNMTKIHPLSLKKIVVALFYILDYDVLVDFIDKLLPVIITDTEAEEKYAQVIINIKLYRINALINLRKFENIESQLISLKKTELSAENTEVFYPTAALFYEAIGNFEEAQNNLFLCLKETNTVYDIEMFVRLSILSKNFFDFAAVSSCRAFYKLDSDCPLKELFISLREGNIQDISDKDMKEILKTKDVSHIKEKMYIMKIMKICFNSEHKFVSFDDLVSKLNLEEMDVIKLILRALGLKVINGWIDSEQRMLFFDSLLPRALSEDELINMKSKFIEWRNRVQKVIDVIENS